MPRVLILHPSTPDFETERALLHLGKSLGPEFKVQTAGIGRGGNFRHLPDAILGLRRMQSDGFDVIHPWGMNALAAAAMAGWGQVIYSPVLQQKSSSSRWLMSIMSHRAFDIVCPTGTQHRMLVEHGMPNDRCHVIRPGVDFSRLRRKRNPELRAEFHFGDNDFVLLAPGESTRPAMHRLAVWAGAIVRELDTGLHVVTWGRGAMANHTAYFARQMRLDGLYIPAEQTLKRKVEFEELATAADAALVTARGVVSTLPISICMAAGLPIVSTVTYTVAELLEDRHTALMVPKPSPRAIAERIQDLREDANLRWKISDTARTEAYEFYSLTRFLNQWRTAYRQAAGGMPINLSEASPVTAHGTR